MCLGGGSTTTAQIPEELRPLFGQTAGNVGNLQYQLPIGAFASPYPRTITGFSDPTMYAMGQAMNLGQMAGFSPATQAQWATLAELPELAAMPVQTPRAEYSQYNLLHQLTGGDVGDSPLLKAGTEAFKKYEQPILQHQSALMGTGRSGELTEATALGLSQMMTPLIQQEIGNRLASVSLLGDMARMETQRYMVPRQQTLEALQFSAGQLANMAQQDFGQKVQAIQLAYQAGQLTEQKAQQAYDAAFEDYQRLYGLAQQSTFGVLGPMIQPSIGSRTEKQPGLMEYLQLAGTIAGIAAMSSREFKVEVEPVDADAVLAAVAALPVASWQYTFEPGIRHIGPMAEDFNQKLGVGDASQQWIAVVDAIGALTASVQALVKRIEALEAR